MIIDSNIQYNFEESLSRIDQMLNIQNLEEVASAQVPILSELPVKGGVVTNCSVLQMKMIMPSSAYGSFLRVYRAFLSEAIAILSSHNHCVDIAVLGTRLTAVFSTPYKKNIESLIDKAAMANSLAQVVSQKARGMGLPDVDIRIGIDYGEALLTRFGVYNASEIKPSSLIWYGRPIEKTSKLIETPNDNYNIWVSGVVYQNLNDEYKKFFHHESEFDCYGADIINIYMKNWLNKQ